MESANVDRKVDAVVVPVGKVLAWRFLVWIDAAVRGADPIVKASDVDARHRVAMVIDLMYMFNILCFIFYQLPKD
jgi:hypothetical protein